MFDLLMNMAFSVVLGLFMPIGLIENILKILLQILTTALNNIRRHKNDSI